MLHQISRFQSVRFRLFILLLCCGILLGQAFLARPALAEQSTAPHLVSPYFRAFQQPAVVSWNNPRKTFVFAAAGDGNIWQRSLTASTLTWSAWVNLGAPPYSAAHFMVVEAVSWTPGRIDVFGIDNNDSVWHKFLINTTWSSAWEDIGTIGNRDHGLQAISWAPGRLDLFPRHAAYCFCHKWWSNGWGPSQAGWEILTNIDYREFHATSWGADRIDLIGRNRDDVVVHKYWDGYSWTPIAGESLNGTTSAAPFSISWGYNRLDIFIRGGTSGNPSPNVYHKAWNGTAWTDWKNIGGNSPETPVTGVSWSANRLDLFEVRRNYDSGDGVYHKAWNGTGGSPSASAWEYIGGERDLSDISAASWGPDRLDLFAVRNDGSLWHLAWNGSAWTPSINSWELINP